ncbi:MAG: hypothetical protein ACQEXQ_21185 [Bacillota bacterium]
MSKFLAAIFSALSVSLFATIWEYTPMNERIENVYYYSFGHLFFFGLPITLGLYIIIAIPTSIFIDSLVSKKLRVRNYKWAFVTLIAYCLAFGVIALLFIAISPMQIERNITRGLILASLVMFSFFMYQELFKWMGKKLFLYFTHK